LTHTSRPGVALAVASLALAGNLACSQAHEDDEPEAVLPSFNDVISAPAAIRTAARAVVRVATAGQMATGSFISGSGLLLTNNHVLGVSVCPLEGCWIQITALHQRGEPYQPSQTVFALPVAADVGLDLAVVQLHASQGGAKLVTPDYLAIRSETPASLLDMHVTVVGHPEGRLKKWTDGVVAYWSGNWFESTAYILPGDSGSPALDDAGQLVGIVHRGPTGEDLITDLGVNVYSIGTASASILSAMGAPMPGVMISTAAATTAAAAVSNDRVYLNGRSAAVTIAGAPASMLTLLGSACDTALARDDFVSPEDLYAALTPCNDATYWMECRVDASPVPYGVVCPSASDAASWTSRFQTMNALYRGMNGTLDLYPISFGIAHLANSMSAGYAAGANALEQAIAQASPELDFTLANYLAAFQVTPYAGWDTAAFVLAYRSVSHYELEATSIASAAGWLFSHHAISRSQLLNVLSQLRGDPRVAVGTKLYVEELEYGYGAL
jgi:V8-like Glu-specific endopeptidase